MGSKSKLAATSWFSNRLRKKFLARIKNIYFTIVKIKPPKTVFKVDLAA
jgi:hypothetical protein